MENKTVLSMMDGRLSVVPFKYVYGKDWAYMYSDEYRGEDFNVYQCRTGEVVAVMCKDI